LCSAFVHVFAPTIGDQHIAGIALTAVLISADEIHAALFTGFAIRTFINVLTDSITIEGGASRTNAVKGTRSVHTICTVRSAGVKGIVSALIDFSACLPILAEGITIFTRALKAHRFFQTDLATASNIVCTFINIHASSILRIPKHFALGAGARVATRR
jgi:hypothetical protein